MEGKAAEGFVAWISTPVGNEVLDAVQEEGTIQTSLRALKALGSQDKEQRKGPFHRPHFWKFLNEAF